MSLIHDGMRTGVNIFERVGLCPTRYITDSFRGHPPFVTSSHDHAEPYHGSMSEKPAPSSFPADIDEIVAVILRDSHGRVLVIRAVSTPEFVLPFGSIDDTINPAHAAQLIAHEAVRAVIDISKLRRLATYVSPAANSAPHTIHAHVYVYEEEISVAHPDKEIAELAWVDPAAPDVDIAPLLKERVFPALQEL